MVRGVKKCSLGLQEYDHGVYDRGKWLTIRISKKKGVIPWGVKRRGRFQSKMTNILLLYWPLNQGI